MEKTYFAGGCFWGVEAAFRRIPGVAGTAVGYQGGTKENPTYQQVCSGNTGHAEVVEVTFDPAKVTFQQLLDFFWQVHDPTTLDRQGLDVGTQYRSAVFATTAEQQAATQLAKDTLNAEQRFHHPVVTEILPAPPFFRAEEYHQRYLEKRGGPTRGL